jgi:hypothetical protein
MRPKSPARNGAQDRPLADRDFYAWKRFGKKRKLDDRHFIFELYIVTAVEVMPLRRIFDDILVGTSCMFPGAHDC